MLIENYKGFDISTCTGRTLGCCCVFSPAPEHVCLGIFSSPNAARAFVRWFIHLDMDEKDAIVLQKEMDDWLFEKEFFDKLNEDKIIAAREKTKLWWRSYLQNKKTAPPIGPSQ